MKEETQRCKQRGRCSNLAWLQTRHSSITFLLALVLALPINSSFGICHAAAKNNGDILPFTRQALLSRGGGGGRRNLQAKASLLKQKSQKSPSKTKAATSVKSAATDNGPTKQPQHIPLSKIDWGVFGMYFCTACTMTLPVLIVPMMDAELLSMQPKLHTTTTKAALSLAAMVASMAPMGGGFGKLVNGFVCQQMGGSLSSKLYFIGSALSSLALANTSLTATTTSTMSSTSTKTLSQLLTRQSLGWIVAAIEFFASIQWTVSSQFLSQYYSSSSLLFARGVTILSLASTSAQISSKVLGALLLQYIKWNQLAHIMVGIAMTGFVISTWTSHNMAMSSATGSPKSSGCKSSKHNLQQGPVRISVKHAIKRVLGNRIFWLIGLVHVSGYLTRTSDRVIGSFLQDVTGLAPQLCGGMTAFMTVGFVYGLMSSSKSFYQQTTVPPKLQILRAGYIRTVASVGGLIAAAAFGKEYWHPYLSAAIITVCASIMASSIAFPFFQMPNMVSSVYFAEVKPVALSLIDGTGFFLTSPIWKIFNGVLLPRYGWSISWLIVAILVSACGTLMMATVPTILEMQQETGTNDETNKQKLKIRWRVASTKKEL